MFIDISTIKGRCYVATVNAKKADLAPLISTAINKIDSILIDDQINGIELIDRVYSPDEFIKKAYANSFLTVIDDNVIMGSIARIDIKNHVEQIAIYEKGAI